MTLELKRLGLLGLVLLALSAIIASPAGADSFTASKYPTSVTATSAKGNDVLKTEGGNLECSTNGATVDVG